MSRPKDVLRKGKQSGLAVRASALTPWDPGTCFVWGFMLGPFSFNAHWSLKLILDNTILRGHIGLCIINI